MNASFTRLCRLLSLAAMGLFAAVGLGLAVLALLLFLGWLPELWAPQVGAGASLTALQRLLVWGLTVLVSIPLMVALAAMSGLFADFARGRVFTERAARAIRRIGGALAAGVVLKVLAGAARSVAVSYTNPPGERTLAFSFGANEVLILLLAGLLVVIGQSMSEAAKMESDMRAII